MKPMIISNFTYNYNFYHENFLSQEKVIYLKLLERATRKIYSAKTFSK